MQRHFDNILLSISSQTENLSAEQISRIDKEYRVDGLLFYKDLAEGISSAIIPSSMPQSVVIARDVVHVAFEDFNHAHGYVSTFHILTYHRINEVFRLAVTDICRTVTSIGFGDEDEALISSLAPEHISELREALANVTSVHVLTKSPPRQFKGLIQAASRIYIHDDNVVPMELLNPSRLRFLYWLMNMTLVNEFPKIQVDYFLLLGKRFPMDFGKGKNKRSVNVHFVYQDYVGDLEDIGRFPSISDIRMRCLTFLVNTTRGYIKAMKPKAAVAQKNEDVMSMISTVSRDFYASANFSMLMTETYQFYESEAAFYDHDESSSLSDSDDDEEEEEEEEEEDAMDVGKFISLASARNQLSMVLAHMGLPFVARLQTMSRAGLIIFIKNLLAVKPEEVTTLPHVTRTVLIQLMMDLNRMHSQPFPYEELVNAQLERANVLRDDSERLTYYTGMTANDIERIYRRYEDITKTGHSTPSDSATITSPQDFMIADVDIDWDDDNPFLEFSEPEISTDRHKSLPAIIHGDADLFAEVDAMQDRINPYRVAVQNVRLDIKVTVFEIIKRNAAYTHQGHPDLLKLLRISRLSELFFQVAIELYIPTLTSLVIRCGRMQLDALQREIQKIPTDQWKDIVASFTSLFRIMSMYNDPIFADDATNERLSPLLMQVYEFRATMYKNEAFPNVSTLFLRPNKLANMRLLVIQSRVSHKIRAIWKYDAKKLTGGEMSRLLKQLSVFIEQPASRPLSRANEARSRYFGGRKKLDPVRGVQVGIIQLALQDMAVWLGGTVQFRPGNNPPVIIWPTQWPPNVVDVEAEKRSRARRTMTDLAVLHELLNRRPSIPMSPLDKRVVDARKAIEDAIAQKDRFQEIVTLENYKRYKYPSQRDEYRMPLEFMTREDFEAFRGVYVSDISPGTDPFTHITRPNKRYYDELGAAAIILNTTVDEIIYACIMRHIKDDVVISLAQYDGTVPFDAFVDLAIDKGIIGWAMRNLVAVRIPSILITEDVAENPMLDIYNTRLYDIVEIYLVNVTEVITSSSLNHPILHSLSKRANTVSMNSNALPIANFSPSILRRRTSVPAYPIPPAVYRRGS